MKLPTDRNYFLFTSAAEKTSHGENCASEFPTSCRFNLTLSCFHLSCLLPWIFIYSFIPLCPFLNKSTSCFKCTPYFFFFYFSICAHSPSLLFMPSIIQRAFLLLWSMWGRAAFGGTDSGAESLVLAAEESGSGYMRVFVCRLFCTLKGWRETTAEPPLQACVVSVQMPQAT